MQMNRIIVPQSLIEGHFSISEARLCLSELFIHKVFILDKDGLLECAP